MDFEVPPEYEGQRLDRFLVSVLGDLSRSQIQRLIADGHVAVPNRSAKANLALHEGDRVSVDIPDAALERAAATHPGGAEGAMSFPNAPTVSILIMCCSFEGVGGAITEHERHRRQA